MTISILLIIETTFQYQGLEEIYAGDGQISLISCFLLDLIIVVFKLVEPVLCGSIQVSELFPSRSLI